MLPNLEEFGINPPVYIRKIDSRSRWNPEGCSNDEERAKRIADSLFKEEVYSLWKVNSNDEFYGVIASLSSRRNPKHQDIDFIWIMEEELQEVGIKPEAIPEGDCLFVQNLHFNAQINNTKAEQLCLNLLRKGRQAQRCKRNTTKKILEYQANRQCKAANSNFLQCRCEDSLEISVT